MNRESERRPCPVCNQRDAEEFWGKEALQLVRCRCAMVFADPVAEEFASGAFYHERRFYLSASKLESDYAPVRFERELRLFRAWCPAGAVLDVGCSTGAFLHQLKTRHAGAYDMLGLDVPGAALDYAETKGVPVRREAFLEIDSAERQFDAVTFWAVMEHLAEPGRFLQKAAQVLKPGGHCFILTPNLRSLAVRLLGPGYRYIMPEHLNYFTAATLKGFARRQQDLEMVDCGSMHFNPLVIWQDFWSRQPGVPDEQRARLLQRTTAWKQSPWLAPLKAFYSGVERMLGSMNLADNIFVVLRRRSSH